MPWFGTIAAKTSSPAVICVQLYEFNSTSLITVNTTNLISIQGSQAIQGGVREPVNGAGNFTVAASQRQVVLGGPTNAGEGTLVAFTITAKPGASGTYSISGRFRARERPASSRKQWRTHRRERPAQLRADRRLHNVQHDIDAAVLHDTGSGLQSPQQSPLLQDNKHDEFNAMSPEQPRHPLDHAHQLPVRLD